MNLQEQISRMKSMMGTINETKKQRNSYDGYSVGDVIVSDGWEPNTGGNILPKKGEKYKLIKVNLDEFPYTRQDVYDNDKGYEEEQKHHLNKMKHNFDELPPIPEEGDGLHRIVVAKELGHDTILMWKKI